MFVVAVILEQSIIAKDEKIVPSVRVLCKHRQLKQQQQKKKKKKKPVVIEIEFYSMQRHQEGKD